MVFLVNDVKKNLKIKMTELSNMATKSNFLDLGYFSTKTAEVLGYDSSIYLWVFGVFEKIQNSADIVFFLAINSVAFDGSVKISKMADKFNGGFWLLSVLPAVIR
jgi:hypothetical protein